MFSNQCLSKNVTVFAQAFSRLFSSHAYFQTGAYYRASTVNESPIVILRMKEMAKPSLDSLKTLGVLEIRGGWTASISITLPARFHLSVTFFQKQSYHME